MQEILNHFLGEIRSALRFRWYGMTAAWIGCLIGWAVVAWLPDVYAAHARVYVDTSSVLQPILANQIIAPDLDAQLAYVQEALLGRDTMDRVVTQAGLDARAETLDERQAVLEKLAASIQIISQGGTRGRPDNLYSISYEHSDRNVAVTVVTALLDNFMENTRGTSQDGGDTAEKFLDERVSEYEARLGQAEQALADFKRVNADRLPGAEGDYFARMQAERDALALAQRDLRIAQSRRDQLVAQLEGQDGVIPATLGDEQELPPGSLDARIRDLEIQLDAALLQYTEKHPDVIALRQSLNQLTAQREERLRALGVEGIDTGLNTLEADPVYQALRIARNEAEVEIATLRADIDERTAKVAELQGLIDEVPKVEAQLARLNRDYDVIYEQYREIVRSREAQQLTRKATDADQIDFRIIDPPLADPFPVAPNRLLLFVGVFFGAIGLGGALCYVLSQLWPVFGSVRNLREVAGLPVLGVVTHAWSERRRVERARAVLGYAANFAILVVVFLGIIAFEMFGTGLHSFVS